MNSKSQRMADAGLTKNKPYPVKKSAPAAKPAAKSAPKPAGKSGKFPSSMSVPGSARPAAKSAASVGTFGRDVPRKSSVKMPLKTGRESEIASLSEMRRSRLGPGQR